MKTNNMFPKTFIDRLLDGYIYYLILNESQKQTKLRSKIGLVNNKPQLSRA
ncbi:hypothetical protein [Flaviramulus multivorans]|uniref:hypothetical protein n=1 Tax=Flaviramulus multivorans TaxID=1304750 RepID=UPI001F3740B5|nr:hypothetical protein [Flaviramulus multivorans]